jgi:hypothetical protein
MQIATRFQAFQYFFVLANVSGSSAISRSNTSVASISARSSSSISWMRREALEDTDQDLKLFDEMTPHDVLCKLKHGLAAETKAAWTPASMLTTMTKYNASDGVLSHGILPVSEGGKTTCAVVSNSGVLSKQEHGQDIDSADVVIRFNDAPLKHWEKNVGSKRSIRLVRGWFLQSVLRHRTHAAFDIDSNELIGIIGHEIEDWDAFRSQYPKVVLRKVAPSLLLSFVKTLKAIYDSDWFQKSGILNYGPTTGAIGMLFAMQHCDEVRAYGMAHSSASSNAPYHYFDDITIPRDQKADQNDHADFRAEKDLWRKIAANGANDLDATDVVVIPGFSQITCS